MMNVSISGADQITKNLNKMLADCVTATAGAMVDVCQDIADRSAPQCPFDTSKLVRSLRAIVDNKIVARGLKSRKIQRMAKKMPSKKYVIQGSVSYDTAYAVRQHEELSFNHPTPGTKAKYLEDPFQANLSQYEKMFENALKGVLR